MFGRSGGAISAAQLINNANVSGIPIYFIDDTNISNVLPLLQINSDIRSEIIASVNSGKSVIIPERDQEILQWKGTGYIIRDKTTGSGAYLISGGLGGGTGSPCDDRSSLPILVAIVLIIVIAVILATVGPALAAGAAIAGAVRFSIKALVASMITGAAAAPVYAALEEACSCNEAYAQCIDTGWTDGLDVSFGTLCQACRNLCTDSGGVVNWPDKIPQLIPIGGGMAVDASCQYPGAP